MEVFKKLRPRYDGLFHTMRNSQTIEFRTEAGEVIKIQCIGHNHKNLYQVIIQAPKTVKIDFVKTNPGGDHAKT
jgi:hypothetical protein